MSPTELEIFIPAGDDDFVYFVTGGTLNIVIVLRKLPIAAGERVPVVFFPSERRKLGEVIWAKAGQARDVFRQIPEDWEDAEDARELLKEAVETRDETISETDEIVTFIRYRKA